MTDIELLRSRLGYCSKGGFLYKITTRKRCGTLKKDKGGELKRYVSFMNKSYAEHRLIWAWHTGKMPKLQIDHIDGNTQNNLIENLRDVSNKVNNMNRSTPKSSTTGIMGVYLYKRTGKWKSGITLDGKQKHLYYGSDLFEAACMRKSAEVQEGFHANHGR